MAHQGDRPGPQCQAQHHHDLTGIHDPVLPAAFYDDPGLSAALAHLDFGPVFRRVRAEKHWSQSALGVLLGMDQAAICKIENGQRRLTEAAIIIRVANVLGIPASTLGFRYWAMVGTTRQKGSGVERRGFLEKVAGLTFGVGVAETVDLHRLLALLPQAEPTGTRHIGAGDVEAINQATAEFVRQDFAQGSGMVRDTALAQLGATLPLLGAQMTDEVRPQLYLATARLAMQTGWMSFEVTHDDAARQLWLIGLELARKSEHPLGNDLTVYLLYDMALQAEALGHPDEALRLVHFGYGAAAGNDVSPTTTSCLASIQARAHAARGDARACDLALHQAVEQISIIDPATAPPWGRHVIDTGMSCYHGTVHYKLAMAGDPRAAGQAVPLLRSAMEGFGPDYGRLRAAYLPALAGAHALAGDLDTAVSVGHQAVEAITSVHSPRAYSGLHRLHTVLEPMRTSPGVTELRERLSVTMAT